MRERVLIFGGLALFLLVFCYPVWRAAAFGTRPVQPQLKLPAEARECVAPIPYMRAAHMQLLIDWREGVVRDHIRQVKAPNGKMYEASLTRTCLGQCHSRNDFCDRCHGYAGVSTLSCWQCHNEPKLVAAETSGRQP